MCDDREGVIVHSGRDWELRAQFSRDGCVDILRYNNYSNALDELHLGPGEFVALVASAVMFGILPPHQPTESG